MKKITLIFLVLLRFHTINIAQVSHEERLVKLEQQVRSLIAQNQEMRSSLEKAEANTVPVGTIVAFHLAEANIPDNWALCDGRKISDPTSIYNGYSVPKLAGYFIRGKTSTESIGEKGGSNIEPPHTHSIPSHSHEVGSHTHYFTTNEASISANKSCHNSTSGLACEENCPNEQFFLAAPYQSTFETATAHSHSGTTGNASSGNTASGGGGTTGAGGGGNNIPEYEAFNYIIKIK